MLLGITRLAIAAPRRVIAVVLLAMVGTAIFGIPVSESLSAGGTRDPTSESSQATKLLSDKFDQGDMAMIETTGLHHVRITVTNLELSRAFYTEVLGFEVVAASSGSPDDPAVRNYPAQLYGGVVFQTNGMLFGLRPVASTIDPITRSVNDTQIENRNG